MWSWSQGTGGFFYYKTLHELWPPRRTAKSVEHDGVDWMWALGMTWLCTAAPRNITFNPKGMLSISVFHGHPSCLWNELFLHHAASADRITLLGLTEQLLAPSPSNQVKWPCVYAGLQLDTSVHSLPLHFADTVLRADVAKRRTVSITVEPELVIFMSPVRLRHPSLLDK